MTVRRPLLFALSVGALVAVPAVAERSAWAIAAPPCTPAAVVPRATTIPANLPAFAYTATTATAANIHLADNTTRGAQALTIGRVQDGLLEVLPSPGLVEGHSYTLDFDPMCTYSVMPTPAPITFTAGPAAPLPTAMGDTPRLSVATVNDYGTSAFTLTTSIALDPSMKPWMGVYQVVVMLDGKVLSTKINQPDADSLALTATGWCDATLSSATHHTVSVRGRLPFAPTVDTTAAALDFVCPAPSIGTSGSDPATPPAVTPGTPGTSTTSTATAGGCNAAGAPLDAAPALALVGLVSVLARLRAAAAKRRT